MTAPTVDADRQVDVQVAEKVLGWQWITFLGASYLVSPEWLPDFLTPGSSWRRGYLGEANLEWSRLPRYRHLRLPALSQDINGAGPSSRRCVRPAGKSALTATGPTCPPRPATA